MPQTLHNKAFFRPETPERRRQGTSFGKRMEKVIWAIDPSMPGYICSFFHTFIYLHVRPGISNYMSEGLITLF